MQVLRGILDVRARQFVPIRRLRRGHRKEKKQRLASNGGLPHATHLRYLWTACGCASNRESFANGYRTVGGGGDWRADFPKRQSRFEDGDRPPRPGRA